MEGLGDARPVLDLLARISRSQFAGLFGNIVGVAAGGALLDFGWLALTGAHLFSPADAEHALEAHHLFASPSLPLAVLTGCAVWLSSMAAGWAEDAAAYGRLQEGLDAGGPTSARGGRLTRWVVRNLSGVVGNVSLAFFLVMLSFTGKVTGLPVDVRHVTVSATSVVLACLSLGDFTTREVAWAAAGVSFIGILNIATGFAISLWVALRSRNAGTWARVHLMQALFKTPLGNPLRFVIPVGAEPTPGPPER
jgi:site-specific recombinase